VPDYIGDLEIGTFVEMAAYITDWAWANTGESRHVFDTSASNVITVDIGSLTAVGQQLARLAFEAWEMVADIDFVEMAFNAKLDFDDNNFDFFGNPEGAYASYNATNGITSSAFINISANWLNAYGTTIDSYSFSTYVHEIGHASGLGHMGFYNGGINFADDGVFLNDSTQLSIMSYVTGAENPNVLAGYGTVVFAQMADIIAVQDLYGAPVGGAMAGDTTYGEGSNLGNYFDDLSSQILFTIFDEGGEDKIDLSGSSSDNIVNLKGGTFSSIGGGLNNVGIAVGAVIENPFLGSGGDIVTANAAANLIETGGGSDTIFGVDIGNVIDGGA
jgi:serralysin